MFSPLSARVPLYIVHGPSLWEPGPAPTLRTGPGAPSENLALRVRRAPAWLSEFAARQPGSLQSLLRAGPHLYHLSMSSPNSFKIGEICPATLKRF